MPNKKIPEPFSDSGTASGRSPDKSYVLSLLLAQDAHRHIEYRRIIERYHAAVRSRFEMNPDALLRLVAASEIVADSFYIDSQFICNALRTAARQPVLDTTQLVKCDNHIS